MSDLASQRHLPTVRINDQAVAVEPKETLLQAALRSGIDFPNSCRVGGCGSCKCKVKKGQVKELTESGYLLSADEIDDGFVLACQSVPQGDVEVEVDLSQGTARGMPGVVVDQKRATHDITELVVQLEQPLAYKAGQFANLAIAGLSGVVRSYSFASPASEDGRVSFFVRHVDGGKMSPLINDTDLRGRVVHVDGPAGKFYLRNGDAPIVMVAGGSGLSPILAMLEEAAARGETRSVSLLFGAREQRDLYALERIQAIAERWQGEFTFVPVLSDAADDKGWQGARGMVTEHIAAHTQPGSHAYLCGPPPMVDAAMVALEQAGVEARHVYFDRFTTQADAARGVEGAAVGRPARLWDYLKYSAFHVLGLLALQAIFLGGRAVTAGLLTVVGLYLLADAALGDDTSTPHFKRPKVLTFQLWLALPILTGIVFAAIWSASPGDPLGAGALIHQVTGVDVLALRAANTLGHQFGIFVLTGLMIGMIGTITAHELTHRTWDPVSMLIGRWLLAFSFDTNFAIEHVYGHHRYVSTREDPATAPRGRNVYHHIVASTIKGNISAWRIEVDRLRKKRLPVFSHHNAVIRGQLMSVSIMVVAFLMGGWGALGFFVACGLWGKSLLEIVNYMEHYGMVRNPETPVQPRHSWNTNRRISSWTMFNLTRHSHHHAEGEVPYHELRPYPEAPMMVNGYLATIILAMIPPVWHRLMTPKILAWDREYATAEELALANEANRNSGIRTLRNTQYPPAPDALPGHA